LIGLYRQHLASADPVGDRSSLHLINRILPDVEAQLKWAETALRQIKTGPELPPFLGELESLWEARGNGPELLWAESLWQPLDRVTAAFRPEGLAHSTPGSLGLLPVDVIGEPRDVAMFLHSDLDEEYATLELIARNSYEHPEMPWQFHLDMARQASDESRHALLVSRLLEDRGYRYGDFPINPTSYDALYQFEPCEPGSQKEILWRMLIRQTFMEGLALDSFANEVRKREAAGQHDIAHAFDYILRDEVFHAESGLRWCKHLLGDEATTRGRGEVLTLQSPAPRYQGDPAVMTNLNAALRIVLPGESAPVHRHASNALRFVLEGGGASTIVDGEDCPMDQGDLIVTPGWSWHEHVHRGTRPTIWLEVGDVPLHEHLGTTGYEPGPPAEAPASTETRRHRWAAAAEAVAAAPLARDGARRVQYKSARTGGPAMAMLEAHVVQLAPGSETVPYRSSSDLLIVVVEGSGATEAGGQRFAWGPKDVITVPHGNRIQHRSNGQVARLFTVSDADILRRLDLLVEVDEPRL